MAETDTPLSLATKLATSYVGNNKVARDELPALINSLHEALAKLESGEEIREPAVPINKSIKRNEILCLECGKGHKMLKRHLTSAHGLTVEEYRTQWSFGARLPAGCTELREAAERVGQEDWIGSKTCRCEIEENGC